jgi:putative peptide maturation system protein
MTDAPLAEGLAFLTAIADARTPPDDALVALGALRGRHPAWSFELIWDEEPASGRVHYDLLIAGALGTIALGLTPPDTLPFPLRGLQRWKEMEVLRIDGRTTWMHEVTTYVDPLWGDADLSRRIVDQALIDKALADDPIAVDDNALQRAVDAFRARHGLDTAAATEAWLDEHGITLPDLESGLAGDLALPQLRRRVTADAHAVFAADPAAFDDVDLIALPAEHADALAAEVRAGASFYAIAERELAGRGGSRGERSVLFETCHRRDLAATEALVEGAVSSLRIRGAGPYVAWVRALRPARWNPTTRAAVEDVLFERWLAERRRRAHIEWNWGRA